MTAPADCRRRAGDILWRRLHLRDWQRLQAFRRWDRGLRNATIPTRRFREFYREAVDALGEERGKIVAELLWPDGLGPMPPPAPSAEEARPC